MFLISVVLVTYVFACDHSLNDAITGINPECNYAGTCSGLVGPFGTIYTCKCCAPEQLDANNVCGEHWLCDPDNPTYQCLEFDGTSCTEETEWFYVGFGFRSGEILPQADGDITCSTDAFLRATENERGPPSVFFHQQVEYVAASSGWTGSVKPAPVCDTCTPAYPCTLGTDEDLNVTEGYTFGFQVDFNEFYSSNCSIDGIIWSLDDLADCDENYDHGQLAYATWQNARGDIGAKDTTFIEAVNDLLWAEPDVSNSNLGLGWNNTVMLSYAEQVFAEDNDDNYITIAPTFAPSPMPTLTPTGTPTTTPTLLPTETPTTSPTLFPTGTPTITPTPVPTLTPTYECGPYTNDKDDLMFAGVGTDCRAGLESSWPGGITCDSPYIVCLPQENTPSAFGDQNYKNSTHRYSVDECLEECANDQRCLGIEFVADTSSSLGDCNLIDDIPPEITSMVDSGFEYLSSETYTNLDSSITGGNSLCFEKKDQCNPYFEAADLNEVMLNCYCPNNRKGYYTKKVKRTVANTRFCGSDTEVDNRIKKAQANRMFHLCENWCLFQTENPEGESWYYDPWKACWREQYAGVGTHKSWCNRVIRSPDTIEMQFVKHRSTLFCQSEQPTTSPSTMNSDWYMADEEDSCDDVCSANGKVCDENLTASVVDSSAQTYFEEALGETCSSIVIGEVDWALPGYDVSEGTCLLRNSATENTGCNWAIGVGYKRLCACV